MQLLPLRKSARRKLQWIVVNIINLKSGFTIGLILFRKSAPKF